MTLENSGCATTKPDVLTAQQLRGARAMLGWSREALAKETGTTAAMVENFERGVTDPKLTIAGRWRLALERAGIIFIDADGAAGPGVRLRDVPAPLLLPTDGKPKRKTTGKA